MMHLATPEDYVAWCEDHDQNPRLDRVPGARVMPWNRPREVERKLADLRALMADGVWHGASIWVDVSKGGASEVVKGQISNN